LELGHNPNYTATNCPLYQPARWEKLQAQLRPVCPIGRIPVLKPVVRREGILRRRILGAAESTRKVMKSG
jgi:hypothetical protein